MACTSTDTAEVSCVGISFALRCKAWGGRSRTPAPASLRKCKKKPQMSQILCDVTKLLVSKSYRKVRV